MELKSALKEQYHAGLSNLRECVEKCSDELWNEVHAERRTWRLAWHTAFFTHFYMAQTEHDFQRWPGDKRLKSEDYDAPDGYSRKELLDYLLYIDGLVDSTVDGLDLSAPETGFEWYPDMTKISHELMNLRHVQGHIGQFSELLMAVEPTEEITWVAKANTYLDGDYMNP